MIVHASTKLDISNYIKWLHNRLTAGYFDKEQDSNTINRYVLKDIEELVLYTRNPSKIYRNRDLFEKYNTKLITFVSLYDQYYEPKIKNKEKIFNAVRKCKKDFNNYFGYGPIFFTNNHSKEWHLLQFEFLCQSFKGFVNGCYLDFTVNGFCQKSEKLNVRMLNELEQRDMIEELSSIAKKYDIDIYMMKRENEFAENEIDMGLVNCCPNACEYCINILNKKAAKDKFQVFDEENSLLYGIISPNQKIVEIDIEKPKEETFSQSTLFDFL